jgi:hypothetical protein
MFAFVSKICGGGDDEYVLWLICSTKLYSPYVQEGLEVKFHQLDIDSRESIERLADFLKSTYGGLDLLVNNAAIAFKTDATEPISVQVRVARWYIFKPKIPIWVNFGGPWNRKDLYILWPFGIYYGHLVYF